MKMQKELICGKVKVVDRKWDCSHGVEDLDGNIIVPYGMYDWIDEFKMGYARVNIKDKEQKGMVRWGLIDVTGKLVVPVEYDEIWDLKDGYTRYVMYRYNDKEMEKENGLMGMTIYGGRPKEGSVYFDVFDGKIYSTQR